MLWLLPLVIALGAAIPIALFASMLVDELFRLRTEVRLLASLRPAYVEARDEARSLRNRTSALTR